MLSINTENIRFTLRRLAVDVYVIPQGSGRGIILKTVSLSVSLALRCPTFDIIGVITNSPGQSSTPTLYYLFMKTTTVCERRKPILSFCHVNSLSFST